MLKSLAVMESGHNDLYRLVSLLCADLDDGRDEQDRQNQQAVDRTAPGGVHRFGQLRDPVPHGPGRQDEGGHDRCMFPHRKYRDAVDGRSLVMPDGTFSFFSHRSIC